MFPMPLLLSSSTAFFLYVQRLMEERNSLKEMVEEMRCTQTQASGEYLRCCQIDIIHSWWVHFSISILTLVFTVGYTGSLSELLNVQGGHPDLENLTELGNLEVIAKKSGKMCLCLWSNWDMFVKIETVISLDLERSRMLVHVYMYSDLIMNTAVIVIMRNILVRIDVFVFWMMWKSEAIWCRLDSDHHPCCTVIVSDIPGDDTSSLDFMSLPSHIRWVPLTDCCSGFVFALLKHVFVMQKKFLACTCTT